VPRRPSRSRRLTTALRWPAGVALTSWTYMWRTTVLHRREIEGTPGEDGPPPLPAGVERSEVQEASAGVGPLFHRVYRSRVRGGRLSAADLMARLQADPNRVAPTELASFQKVHGEVGAMRVGDEYVVRMPGPWDGPIRVVAVGPRSFRFATLDGHLEAGQIEWAAADADGDLLFRIESWARGGDRLSYLLHHRLRMAKEVQLHMWTSVHERVARLAGGRLTGGIDIETRRVDAPAGVEADQRPS
jgi:hypothetical protein